MKRYTFEEVTKGRDQLTAHAKLNRAIRVPYTGLRKAVVGALMVTTSPELAKVHPAYSASGAWDRRYKIAEVLFSYSSGYDKDTDTFATLCTADAIRVIVQDHRLTCTRCKGSAEYEGEYGPKSCMGCLVEEHLDLGDGRGNLIRLEPGNTLVWFSDMTFEVKP